MHLLGEVTRTGATPIYTAAVPRGGTQGLFIIEVMQMLGAFSTLDAQVQHKNMDEQSFTDAATFTFSEPFVPGIHPMVVGGLKELVRLKVTHGSGDFLRIRVYEPQWSD